MYDYVTNGIIGVVAGVLSAIVYNTFWPRIRERRYDRALASFWRFRHKVVYVVRPSYKSPSGEDMGENMARVEDVLAIDKITEMLKRRDMPYHVVDHAAAVPEDADLILVCSPKGNRRSAEELGRLPLPFSFEMDESKTPYFVDGETKVKYQSPMDTAHDNIDIALVGRYTRRNGQVVFLLWGIHGVGTLGAAQASTDRELLEHANRLVLNRDFAVLVECKFAGITDIQECQLLTQPRFEGGHGAGHGGHGGHGACHP